MRVLFLMFISTVSAGQRITQLSSSYPSRRGHLTHDRVGRTLDSMATSSFAKSGLPSPSSASSSTRMSGSSLGSSLSSTFQSVSSLFNRPRVHQMKSRCTSDDVMGMGPNSAIFYTIVQRALTCNPANGSTVGFTNCLANSFPDLAPTEECYNCILEFVDLNRPSCDPSNQGCIKQTATDLWAVCSP